MKSDEPRSSVVSTNAVSTQSLKNCYFVCRLTQIETDVLEGFAAEKMTSRPIPSFLGLLQSATAAISEALAMQHKFCTNCSNTSAKSCKTSATFYSYRFKWRHFVVIIRQRNRRVSQYHVREHAEEGDKGRNVFVSLYRPDQAALGLTTGDPLCLMRQIKD
jgi:hypothetical protein